MITWHSCLPRWRRELTRLRRRIGAAPTGSETEQRQAAQLIGELDELVLSLDEMIDPDEVDNDDEGDGEAQ